MIVSWDWLKEYVRLDMSVEALVERLLMSGLNHESTTDVDGDLAVDLEVTSNRPDCLGHLGIAREIAVLFDRELKLPPLAFAEHEPALASQTSVTVAAEAAEWCPQYRARLILGVNVGPSPLWLQRRLRTVGLTPINNVVDITNYVLHECGQPLHAFDYDKLAGKRIVVRNALPGEKFVAINNRLYELAPTMGVIADAQRAVAIAGVMGGADTEVSATTTNILLESAEFAPIGIRQTSRTLDLSSDSSYRFERKVDPAGIAWASERACALIAELAGGRVARGFVHVGIDAYRREPVTLRWRRLSQILGIDVPPARAAEILEKLGLKTISQDGERITVIPPTFRRDLTREIDLVEEVGRIHGYQTVPENCVIPLSVAPRRKEDRVVDVVRETLCAGGFCEAVTFSFIERKLLETIRPWTLSEPLAVRHSSRKQENQLRQSLLPSLVDAVRLNEARGNRGLELFEIAQVYLPQAGTLLPREPFVIGVASTQDVRALRGYIEALFERLRIEPKLIPAPVSGLAEGQSAEYLLGGQRLGILGVVADSVRSQLDLRSPTVVAEILLPPLVDAALLIPTAQPVPDQPAVDRDLNFELEERVRWAELETTIRAAAGPFLESLEFVDLYRGKQVAAGCKSITSRLVYRALDRTLTREEVDGYQQAIIAAVSARLGGRLRA